MASTPPPAPGTPGSPYGVQPTAAVPLHGTNTPPSTTNPGSTLPTELRVYSHSMLFYWWPVWFFGFLFAIITAAGGDRLAIIPERATVKENVREVQPDKGNAYKETDLTITYRPSESNSTLSTAVENQRLNDGKTRKGPVFRYRVSDMAWMGEAFCFILLLVIFTTNVPLRGLWAYMVLASIAIVGLLLRQFGVLGSVADFFADLDIFINMGGYMTIATTVFILWALAFFIFDRRRYMIFTPGQVRVREEVGEGEKIYETTGIMTERHRDDLFRHVILGFGTGDLTVKTSGAERSVHTMENVFNVDRKLEAIQQMTRARKMV